MTLSALTLHQPWASAVVLGMKRVETRSWCWGLPPGSALAIHAGTSKPSYGRDLFREFSSLFANHGYASFDDLPFGAFVGVARVAGMHETSWLMRPSGPGRELFHRHCSPALELPWGDYSAGRYAWLLDLAAPLPIPISWRGQRRIWAAPELAQLRSLADRLEAAA